MWAIDEGDLPVRSAIRRMEEAQAKQQLKETG
jgi:hypothetical protein